MGPGASGGAGVVAAGTEGPLAVPRYGSLIQESVLRL